MPEQENHSGHDRIVDGATTLGVDRAPHHAGRGHARPSAPEQVFAGRRPSQDVQHHPALGQNHAASGSLSLFDEQRRVHRARQIVAQVPAIVPLGVYVDGLFYTGPPEADAALQQLAKAEQYEHDFDCKVYKFKKCLWHQVPQCEQFTSHGRQSFKPRLRREWDKDITERDIEQRVAAHGLDQPAIEE